MSDKEIKLEVKSEKEYYLRNVPLVYTALKNAKENKDDTGTVTMKYEVTAIIPEEIADELDSAGFDKPATRKVIIKKGDKPFEEKYHMDRPEWVAESKHFAFTLRARSQYKDKESGEMVDFDMDMQARPKAYMKNTKTGKVENITETKLIGNGSVGDIYFTTYATKHGTMASVSAVFIHDLVELEARSSFNPFEEFGEMDVPTFDEKEKKEEQKPQSPPSDDADFDDDIPF